MLDMKLNLRGPTFEVLELSAAELPALFEHPLPWRDLSHVIVILILADPTRVALLTALFALRQFSTRPAVTGRS
ncbi:hypothetical protein [Salipiger thiooxidans]|uniref:hypothetical protein n=1 Tax=Salipiger thiooxidans TaxID=282683 RepID=UPI0013F4F49E|nr:hypothetical protein [Salipiger thiooxidans]